MNRRSRVVGELVLSAAGEEMTTDRCKALGLIEIHVGRNMHYLLPQHNHVEGVLFALASSPAPGCRGAALDNNNAPVAVVAWIDI